MIAGIFKKKPPVISCSTKYLHLYSILAIVSVSTYLCDCLPLKVSKLHESSFHVRFYSPSCPSYLEEHLAQMIRHSINICGINGCGLRPGPGAGCALLTGWGTIQEAISSTAGRDLPLGEEETSSELESVAESQCSRLHRVWDSSKNSQVRPQPRLQGLSTKFQRQMSVSKRLKSSRQSPGTCRFTKPNK